MKIKVCGMKYPGNISAVAALQPDYMGFIFYSQSPRFVAELDVMEIPAFKTGVFVNENIGKVKKLTGKYQLDAIQLHGNESPDYCEVFKDKVIVIKAFGVDETFDFGTLEPYAGKVDYFLFDTKTSKHGGSGQIFDWSLLDRYKLDVPFFLSGGLSPENIAEVQSINHPQFYGVDLNSKFEIEPGLKDIDKLRKAFDILR
ncbi:MAG: phosphoribosylanthranilate isomerase [Bacteroidetes bacterium]|nr:phosphoribosylanthranilate isomerase [Bacteroidota bacterium]